MPGLARGRAGARAGCGVRAAARPEPDRRQHERRPLPASWPRSSPSSQAVVVEDDHSGDIATGEDVSLGRHLPDRTVHIRSYSKSHGPDLRIAAVGGSADVIDPLVSRRMLGPGWTSRLLQAVLVELLTDPAAIAAVTRARATYAMRSLAVRAGLAGEGVVSTMGDGINAWVEVGDERSALITLAALGVRVSPGSPVHGGRRAEQPRAGHDRASSTSTTASSSST